jgi:hypothetical protein
MTNELYKNHNQRLDTVLGDYKFWAMMSQCRKTEGATACETNAGMFNFFKDTYGIQLKFTDSEYIGNISQEVKIVDEQKYVVFLLKYSQ